MNPPSSPQGRLKWRRTHWGWCSNHLWHLDPAESEAGAFKAEEVKSQELISKELKAKELIRSIQFRGISKIGRFQIRRNQVKIEKRGWSFLFGIKIGCLPEKKKQKTNQRSDRHLATKKEHQKVASKIIAKTPKISLKCLILACGPKFRIFAQVTQLLSTGVCCTMRDEHFTRWTHHNISLSFQCM